MAPKADLASGDARFESEPDAQPGLNTEPRRPWWRLLGWFPLLPEQRVKQQRGLVLGDDGGLFGLGCLLRITPPQGHVGPGAGLLGDAPQHGYRLESLRSVFCER